MKTFKIGLLNSNPSNVYNKHQTYMADAVSLKTLPAPYNDSQVMGAPLTKFIDVYSDTIPVAAFTPGMMCQTLNNRLFILQSAPATGVANNIVLYNFNLATGVYSYAGRIAFAISAPATITVTGFKVDDSNPLNTKIFITYRSTTASMGGLYVINKVTISSFVPSGYATYYAAQADDVAGVYCYQLPKEVGGAHLMTTAAGLTIPKLGGSPTASINTKVFVHNGISATHQKYIFDYSIAPLMAPLGTSTVTAVNTTGASTTFTMAGNTLAVGDMVIIKSGAPTAYTNSAASGAQTVYYVVATNFVAGSTFSLSATSGGAILAATGTSTTTVFARANGQSVNSFVAKTANLPSLGGGTLLLTNSENYAVPQQGLNAGQECTFMATTTNFLLGKYSELWSSDNGNTTNGSASITGLASTSGLVVGMTVFGSSIPAAATILSIDSANSITISANATATGAQALTFGAIIWPSLSSINTLGSGVDYVVPAPTQAFYSDTLDKVCFLIAGSIMMIKNWVNNAILANFGNTGNSYMEAQNHVTDPAQLAAIASIENSSGWLFQSSSATTGQRGIIAMNLKSDYVFDKSYIVSPIIATGGSQRLKAFSTIEKAFDYTSGGVFSYRTAATESDAIFNSPTGGWNVLETAVDLDILLNNFTQFKIAPLMTAVPNSPNISVSTPHQIVDAEYTVELVGEISDKWEYSQSDSSPDIPTRAGFVLRTAYPSGSVPKLYFRAWDTSSNIITQANTTDNAGNFEHSTDGGLTWSTGAIPNVVDTRLRYTWTTPPGVSARVAIQES